MENFDSMLDEIDRFQHQTASLVSNLQAIDAAMGNRELEIVDDDENDPNKKPKGLNEADLAMQQIYNYNSKIHTLKDQTCSICLLDITDCTDQEGAEKKEKCGANMVCTLTCGHSFHAPCVLGWLTKQSHCCPNCRKDLRVSTEK